MTRRNCLYPGPGLVFLAIFCGLLESSARAEVTIEAARSYYSRDGAFKKLQRGLECHRRGDFLLAERFYRQVLWESRDPEQIAAAEQLMLQVEEARVLTVEPLGPSFDSKGLAHALKIEPIVPDPPSLEAAGRPLLSWLESSLPVAMDTLGQRLARSMEALGQEKATRVFTEKEFDLHVNRQMRRRFPNEIVEMATQFRRGGIIGSGVVQLGGLKFKVFSRMEVIVERGRPHAVVREAKIGTIPVPAGLLKLLERRVNRVIDQQKCPIRVKVIEFHEGTAKVSVELS